MSELYTISGLKNNDLCHHGIKGQKWYLRRYQNPDGSLTPAGKKRYAKDKARAENKELRRNEKTLKKLERTESKLQKKELKAQIKSELEEKALLDKKQKIFNSGDSKKMYENRHLFTNEEINAFNARKRAEESIKPERKEKKTGLEKAETLVNNLSRATGTAIKGFDTYTKAATMINRISGKETLPTFDIEARKKKIKEQKEKKRRNELNNMSLNQFLNNLSSMTTEEIKDRRMREQQASLIRNALRDEEQRRQELDDLLRRHRGQNTRSVINPDDATTTRINSGQSEEFINNLINSGSNLPNSNSPSVQNGRQYTDELIRIMRDGPGSVIPRYDPNTTYDFRPIN